MTVESIQRIYSTTPLYRQEEVVKTAVDPLTQKQTQEIIVYKLYNSRAEVEETYHPKIDTRA
jgi:hypothetical protein